MSNLVPPADQLDLPEVPAKATATGPPIRTLPPQFLKPVSVTSTPPPQPQELPRATTYQHPPPPPPPASVQRLPLRPVAPRFVSAPPPPHAHAAAYQQPVDTVKEEEWLQHFLFIFQTAAESLDDRPSPGTAYQVGHAIEALGAIIPDAAVRDSFREYGSKYPLHNYLTTSADCLGWIYAALEIPVPQPQPYFPQNQPRLREDMGYPAQETAQRPLFPYIPPNMRIAGILGTPANYRVGFNKQHARSLERLQYSAQRFRRATHF